MTDDEIRQLCLALAQLLSEPHPGLSTWQLARQATATKLRRALDEVLGDGPRTVLKA